MASRVIRKVRDMLDVDDAAIANGKTLVYRTASGKHEYEAAGGAADLSSAVILAPAASARNVIQPTAGSVIAAVVKAHAAQTTDLLQFQSSAGTVLSRFNKDGWLGVGVAPDATADIYRAVTGAGNPALVQTLPGLRVVTDFTSPNDAAPGNTVVLNEIKGRGVSRAHASASIDHIVALSVLAELDSPTTPASGDDAGLNSLSVLTKTSDANTWPAGILIGLSNQVAHEAAQDVPSIYGFQSFVTLEQGISTEVIEANFGYGWSLGGVTIPTWKGMVIAPPYLEAATDIVTEYVGLDIDRPYGWDEGILGTFDDFIGIRVRDASPQVTGNHYGVLVEGGKSVFVDTLLTGKIAAPADADIANSQGGWWWDQANSLPKWKGKTSGGVVVNFVPDAAAGSGIPATIVDAKGDLIAATAADTVARLAVGSNDQVLTADSAQATGLKWAAAAGGGGAPTDAQYIVGAANGSLSAEIVATAFALSLIDDADAAAAQATLDVVASAASRGIRHTAGASLYYTAPQFNPGSSTSSKTMTTDKAWFVPFWVPKAITADRIGVGIWSGVATSVVRLGIYRDNGSGKPGALVVDAGTVATSGTGFVEITISQALTADLYWLVAVSQTAAASLRSIAYVSPSIGASTGLEAVSNTANMWSRTGVSGALPDPAGTVAADANTTPTIAVRVT